MIKKLFLLGLVVSQLTTSCSNDKDNNETDSGSLKDQIANLIKQPYSSLTSEEQKVKLEAEANEMLVQLDESKSSSAIEAIENLSRLLDISSVDIFSGKNDNEIEDIINTSGVYGIYTWNNTQETWTKTASTTELKFVFPAKETQTTNNASFSTKATSSDIKVAIYDSYDWQTDVETNDYIFLPNSSEATLTIDNKEAATFSLTAKYNNGKEVPNEFSYKMSLNDGYSWEMSGTKATENTSKASLKYNGKSLIEFNAGSSANIDGLLNEDGLTQYYGKANGLFRLMDNFVIVADMDLATGAADEEAFENTIIEPEYPEYNNPNSNYKAFYTAWNEIELKRAKANTDNFNKNMDMILVSKKDGTKIATLVKHYEKSEEYTFNLPVWDNTNNYWSWYGNGELFTEVYYDEVIYLKFNDNTEVEMSAYFSEGFDNFETKFEAFIKAFEK